MDMQNALQGQPQQVSPINREFEQVGKELTQLENAISELEGSLSPVMVSSSPTCGEDSEKQCEPDTLIGKEIRNVADRISSSSSYIHLLVSRIQV